MNAETSDPTNSSPDTAPNPSGDRGGFWVSMAVLFGFLLFIAVAFGGAYFMMQPIN